MPQNEALILSLLILCTLIGLSALVWGVRSLNSHPRWARYSLYACAFVVGFCAHQTLIRILP